MARNWTKEDIKKIIATDAGFRMRALIKLYERQTSDEQAQRQTKYNNNVGFQACDAKKMTGIAKWAIDRKFLTAKQDALVHRRLYRYAGQLADIANGNR